MDETILVEELGQLLEFSFTDMLCYAGPFSPAGVASCVQSYPAGVRGAVAESPAATAIDRDPRSFRRARDPRRH